MTRPFDPEAVARVIAQHRLGSGTLIHPSVIVRDLVSGEEVQRFPETPFYPACMIKVPLAIVCHRLAATGAIALDERLTVGEHHVTETGPPVPYRAGSVDTIEGFLFNALHWSDNIATNVIMDRIDREEANRVLHALGLTRTFIRRKISGTEIVLDAKATGRNEHPAADAAAALALLVSNAVPGARAILDCMRMDVSRLKVNAGFEPEDDVIFKYGYTSSVTHYAAILTVAEQMRYLIVVYTAMGWTRKTQMQLFLFTRALRSVLLTGVNRMHPRLAREQAAAAAVAGA